MTRDVSAINTLQTDYMATTRRAGAGPSAPAVYTGPVTHWEKQVIEWGTTGIVTTRWVDMKINNKMAYPGR